MVSLTLFVNTGRLDPNEFMPDNVVFVALNSNHMKMQTPELHSTPLTS